MRKSITSPSLHERLRKTFKRIELGENTSHYIKAQIIYSLPLLFDQMKALRNYQCIFHLPKDSNQKKYLMNQNAYYISVCTWNQMPLTLMDTTVEARKSIPQTCTTKDWNIHDTTNSHYPSINLKKRKEKEFSHKISTENINTDSPARDCQFNLRCWRASWPGHVRILSYSNLNASAAYLSFSLFLGVVCWHTYARWELEQSLCMKREWIYHVITCYCVNNNVFNALIYPAVIGYYRIY